MTMSEFASIFDFELMVSPSTINSIIALHNYSNLKIGVAEQAKEMGGECRRVCEVASLAPRLSQSLEVKLLEYLSRRYDVEGFHIHPSDPINIVRYGVGGCFDWHADRAAFENNIASKREISFSIQASASGDYVGGDIEFWEFPDGVSNRLREKGQVTFFSSQLGHRITPVVSGTRWSIVGWFHPI